MNDISQRAQTSMGNPNWPQNWTSDGLQFYGELMELASGKIWLCQQTISLEEYAALTPPEGFIKSGIGRASHDAAFFRRPPHAQQDEPLETMAVGERTFAQVAIPGEIDRNFDIKKHGLLVLKVQKHHSVMFAKGRTLEVLSMGDGYDYVPQVTEIQGLPGFTEASPRVLPEGWSVREVTLEQDLFVEIPFPARVCFFTSGHSFQGPVKLKI